MQNKNLGVEKMNYASFGKRLLAWLLDMLILDFISWFIIYLFGYYFSFFALAAQWLYFACMESSPRQGTLGKIALGIVVTDMQGNPIDFAKATGRFFSKIISGMILGIGYLMAAFSQNSQALHDMMAGTLVLEKSAVPAYAPQVPQPAQAAAYHNGGYRVQPAIYGLTGEYSGRSIPVDDHGITMGRDSAYCQVSFLGEAQGISRRHCTVNFNRMNGCFILTDIGSSYGTYLESGMKVVQGQSVTLQPGSRFYLADRNNMFEVRVSL